MKKLLGIGIVIIILLSTSCDLFNLLFSDGDFWAQNMETGTYYRVDADKLASNNLCEVWAEKGSGITSAAAQEIAGEYANKIYPELMAVFGWEEYIPGYGNRNTMQYADLLGDRNGKLIILLLDIKDGYKNEGDSYVAGYFSAINFYDEITVRQKYPNHKTNRCDMIYVDTNPGLNPLNKSDTYRTIAHELQHLMNFVTSNYLNQSNIRDGVMDLWIDEGLSAGAEYVYSGTHSVTRIDWYNRDDLGTIAGYGNNFFIWDNYDIPDSVLDDYATVYMFFQYLRLHGPDDIYYKIMTSNYRNFNAVTVSFGKSWDTLLGDWLAANYINNSTGVYGYRGESAFANLTKHHLNSEETVFPLYPGEAVYSYVSEDTYPVPSGSGVINYLGMGAAGIVSEVPVGGALLTYNVNTNNLEKIFANGIVTGNPKPAADIQTAQDNGARSILFSPTSWLGPQPIGAHDLLRRNGYETDNLEFIKFLRAAENE